MACICILQKKPSRTNSSRNCWSLQAPRTRKEIFTCWVLKHKSNRRGLFVFKTYSQAETLNSRLTYTEVFTSLSNENFINGRADTSWTAALRVMSAIPHSSCLQRWPISYMSEHTSVNLGPMTHNSCFPEHSNQYCKETCCRFFFSPHSWVAG